MQVDISAKVSGHFTLTVRRPDGSVRQETSFPNLITDGGLDRMGANADWLTWCQVGSGSTAPSVTDGSLVNRIAGSNTKQASANGNLSADPYYAWTRNTYRFGTGVATGNLSEVGIGWASTGSLFSRALILDGLGDPTTITILADETLDVTYEFRYYPNLTDITGTTAFTGNLAGSYDWVLRPAQVTGSTRWQTATNGTSMGNMDTVVSGFVNAYNGALGAVTSFPSGTAASASSLTAAAYSAGSYSRAADIGFALNNGNLSGGISALRFKLGIGTFQIGFTPAIPKTASDTLTLTVSHTWARRP
jgi:hypothetical protein